ncbi:hypothetical protein ISCGN_016808 [Ixodes scapularis]
MADQPEALGHTGDSAAPAPPSVLGFSPQPETNVKCAYRDPSIEGSTDIQEPNPDVQRDKGQRGCAAVHNSVVDTPSQPSGFSDELQYSMSTTEDSLKVNSPYSRRSPPPAPPGTPVETPNQLPIQTRAQTLAGMVSYSRLSVLDVPRAQAKTATAAAALQYRGSYSDSTQKASVQFWSSGSSDSSVVLTDLSRRDGGSNKCFRDGVSKDWCGDENHTIEKEQKEATEGSKQKLLEKEEKMQTIGGWGETPGREVILAYPVYETNPDYDADKGRDVIRRLDLFAEKRSSQELLTPTSRLRSSLPLDLQNADTGPRPLRQTLSQKKTRTGSPRKQLTFLYEQRPKRGRTGFDSDGSENKLRRGRKGRRGDSHFETHRNRYRDLKSETPKGGNRGSTDLRYRTNGEKVRSPPNARDERGREKPVAIFVNEVMDDLIEEFDARPVVQFRVPTRRRLISPGDIGPPSPLPPRGFTFKSSGTSSRSRSTLPDAYPSEGRRPRSENRDRGPRRRGGGSRRRVSKTRRSSSSDFRDSLSSSREGPQKEDLEKVWTVCSLLESITGDLATEAKLHDPTIESPTFRPQDNEYETSSVQVGNEMTDDDKDFVTPESRRRSRSETKRLTTKEKALLNLTGLFGWPYGVYPLYTVADVWKISGNIQRHLYLSPLLKLEILPEAVTLTPTRGDDCPVVPSNATSAVFSEMLRFRGNTSWQRKLAAQVGTFALKLRSLWRTLDKTSEHAMNEVRPFLSAALRDVPRPALKTDEILQQPSAATMSLDPLVSLVRSTIPNLVLNYLGFCVVRHVQLFTPTKGHNDLQLSVASREYQCVQLILNQALTVDAAEYVRYTALKGSVNFDSLRVITTDIRRVLASQISTLKWLDKATRKKALARLKELKVRFFFERYMESNNAVQARTPAALPAQGLITYQKLRELRYRMRLQDGGEDAALYHRSSTAHEHCSLDATQKTLLLKTSLVDIRDSGSAFWTLFQTPTFGTRLTHCLLRVLLQVTPQPESGAPSSSSLNSLKNVSSCLKRQYTPSSRAEESPVSERTLEDTLYLAENGALSPAKKVFDAYASKLTEQPSSSSLWSGLKLGGLTWSHLFYVAYAQAQCPEGSSVESNSRLATTTLEGRLRERIVIPLSNDPAFHDTFTCRRGSGMNPDTSCLFWVR